MKRSSAVADSPSEAASTPPPLDGSSPIASGALAPGERLQLRERLSYGLGDFASGLYWQALTVYLTYFYTDVFGLSALAAASRPTARAAAGENFGRTCSG